MWVKHIQRQTENLFLSRMRSFLSAEKRRIVLKSFIESQFKYCHLTWMFCSQKSNNKINRLHEKPFRIVHNHRRQLSSIELETHTLVDNLKQLKDTYEILAFLKCLHASHTSLQIFFMVILLKLQNSMNRRMRLWVHVSTYQAILLLQRCLESWVPLHKN